MFDVLCGRATFHAKCDGHYVHVVHDAKNHVHVHKIDIWTGSTPSMMGRPPITETVMAASRQPPITGKHREHMPAIDDCMEVASEQRN